MEITFGAEEVYVADKAIDFRAGINTLCALVVEYMQKEPSKGIYVFYNKNLDCLKVLGWHRNGFVMLSKRLESGKFFIRGGDNLQLNSEQLNWLLIGVDWQLLSGGECKVNAYF
jgi:transposase